MSGLTHVRGWILLAALLPAAARGAEVQILPTPQYLEISSRGFTVPAGGTIQIVLAPTSAASSPKLKLAADYLKQALTQGSIPVQVTTGGQSTAASIHLWNWAADQKPPVPLNPLDRQTLSDPKHFGQSYVIRMTDDHSMWAVGGSDQGVLYAAMTILQAIHSGAGRVDITGLYVRDYPDFEFRAASDWLLYAESFRWSLDRGQGIEGYKTVVKQKLDRALRYKINMALMDGVGFGLKERFTGYGEMMRDLNAYARARGIHLLYVGYGASYDTGHQTDPKSVNVEGGLQGQAFLNRESYPDGPTYQCMGFESGVKGQDASTWGTCRGNDELNRVKAEELRAYVAGVEPGALYIHHEDFGNFRGTERSWQKRCVRCRKRWPNDALLAPDGGAGGFSHGYSALVRAVNSVKNPATGYDAERDCQIVLISPVYMPDSPAPEDWANALEFWKNVGLQLPKSRNIQIGFREVFPQRYGNEKWSELFNATMEAAGLNFGQFMFFAGGADNWATDYPLTGVPAMNRMFSGVRTMYNETGDFYREPMELISAEYSWNYRSTGFFTDPPRNTEARDIWHRYMLKENQPEAIFGAGKLYDRACDLLYGPRAGAIMASYYRESAVLPDVELGEADRAADRGYLPGTWNRLYSLPSHAPHLDVDSRSWGVEIENQRFASMLARMKLDRKELHRRLARRWGIAGELNRKGAGYVQQALSAGPPAQAVDDLRFLETSFRVYQPFLGALADYHAGLEAYFSTPRNKAVAQTQFRLALEGARAARNSAVQAFPQPIDPVGAEVGALRRYTELLIKAIETIEKTL